MGFLYTRNLGVASLPGSGAGPLMRLQPGLQLSRGFTGTGGSVSRVAHLWLLPTGLPVGLQSILSTWQLASPRPSNATERAQRKPQAFYDQVLEATCHHFCHILFGRQVGSVQCLRGMNIRRWGSLGAWLP